MRFFSKVLLLFVAGIVSFITLKNAQHGGNIVTNDGTSAKDYRSGGYQGDPGQEWGIDTSDGRRLFNLHLLPKSRDDVVDVMVCSDTRTLGGMVAAVNSAILNTRSTLFFHLVTISEEIEHIAAWLLHYHPFIIMEVVPFDDDISDKLVIRGKTRKELASSLNFARFWMPRLFPHLHGRVVYLDDDVLVLGDLKEMKDHVIREGHVLAASADEKNTMGHFFNFNSPTIQSLGIRQDEHAFNAGVFVCDIDAWRGQQITETLVHWMTRNTQEELYGGGIAGGASQPPMLIALHGKVTELDPNWHVRHFGWWMGNKYPDEILKTAKLMHWNGRFKPWLSGRASRFAPVWHRFYLPDPWGKFKVTPPDAPPMKVDSQKDANH